MKKKIIVLLLSCTMLATSGCSAQVNVHPNTGTSNADEVLDCLSKELEESSDHLMKTGEDVDDIYSELSWTSVEDTLPAKFDLRDRGTVTAVKSQNPWGSCWSFATVGASETGILNSMGLTVDSFREKYGEDMDLSEKHLAWFTAHALPELDEYPEGEYPYDPSQAGEGFHPLEENDREPLDMGGNFFLSATSLADGIGILKEKYAPYTNSEGNAEKDGDWSLPEEERYILSYELKDANILPSPSSYDKDDNYVYRPAATEAIKTELLAGRAVGVSFLADQSRPEETPKDKRDRMKKDLQDIDVLTEEEKDFYIDV